MIPWRARLNAETVTLAAFIVPAILVVVLLQLYPLAYSAYMAFEHWNLTEAADPLGWVGLDNFKNVVTDRVFRNAVKNSFIITGAAVAIELVLGTALAYLTLGGTWLNRSARTLLILPMVIAPVAAGTIWRMLLNPRTGPVNSILDVFGIHGPQWLAEPNWAIFALILVDVWQWTPFVLLVVAAGAAAISSDMLEAAAVDGASRWQAFRRVELPLLVPILALVVMFRLLESILSLDTVYSLTFGGPGYGTYTLTFYLYALGLRSFALGDAAAGSWLFMLFAAAVIAFAYRLHRRTTTVA
jgi:multiple sugar transport system permease protein